MLLPIRCKSFAIFRTNNDHLSLPLDKFLIILAQLRHVPLAEWSGKAAVEHEQNVRFTAEIRKAKQLTLEIEQGDIGGGGVKSDLGQLASLLFNA